ncbi:major facilitator superfamily MFS_1 [Sphingobium chlorophenolicum L-1]|uniref:Major facilitator superfamily MFS_1 n=1 Tax=Sphingobium chlorophenolicum L-1 TaxID=690566 RepID=F6F2T7_SPHCR|nr:MFS transporter [Sphingobium chlorophenolicum]AEG50749.1 major facilitator superfamily MFS_1 [Sphingobium chlorophenolicum L-1]
MPRAPSPLAPLSAVSTVRNPWLTVAALSAMTLSIQGCTLMSLGVFLPDLAPDFGGQAGGAATAFLLAMSLASLAVGWALGRIGARPVLLAGIALAAAGYALAAVAQDRVALTAGLALAGMGVGASTIVPGIAVITRHHAARRGLALAIFLGAAVVAGALVPPLVGAAIALWSWRTAMLLCAAVMALACPPLLLLVPGGRIDGEGTKAKAAAIGPDFLRILLASTLLQLAINGVLFAAVDSLMAQGLSRSGAVLAYSGANLLGLPALLMGGMLADRIGPRRSLIATALLLAAGTAALLGATTMAGVWLFVLLWGTASALPGQSGSMLLADVAGAEGFPRLLGINTAIIGLLGALAPMLTDQMRAAGGHGLPIWVYAAMALAAAPVIAMVRPSKADAG